MKVEFNSHGDLRITPENSTERYALKAWSDGKKAGKIAGRFVIDVTPPPMPPSMPSNPEHVAEF